VDIGQITSDLNNLDVQDFKKIGTAPLAARAFILALLFAAIVGAGIWFLVKPKFATLEGVAAKEQTLKTQFDETQSKAANREAYVEQLSEMKRTFNVMLRQLPNKTDIESLLIDLSNKTDIESLLIDLSQTSVASGLEVESFKPKKEIAREFYVEYPITIKVTGNYHQFGNFVSGLAALPRIVTLHNITIKPSQAKSRSDKGSRTAENQKLEMTLVATTYRYLCGSSARVRRVRERGIHRTGSPRSVQACQAEHTSTDNDSICQYWPEAG